MTVRNRPTVQDYVDRIEAKIAFNRQRASKLIRWGRTLGGPVAYITLGLGFLALVTASLNASYRDPLVGRPILRFLVWYTQNYPAVWTFLTWLGPSISGPSFGDTKFILWAVSWILHSGGSMVRIESDRGGQKLRAQADKDTNTLEFQEPTWRQLEALTTNMQAIQANVTNVGGSVDISNTSQQMQTMLQRGEGEKPWWTKPAGVIAVRGELISHAAIGVWYNPRQCLRHRYESRPIGDVGPLAADSGTPPSSPACVRWPL